MIITRHFPEMWYTVVAEVNSHWVDFKVYAISSIEIDGSSVSWSRKNASSWPDPVDTVEEAQVFLHGSVKWDGCSNWYFDEQDQHMLHQCDRQGLTNIGLIMATCWDMANELCPNAMMD